MRLVEALRDDLTNLTILKNLKEDIDWGRTKFWYHPIEDRLIEFSPHDYHSDHLAELGVPQEEIDKINDSYGDYKYRGNYHNDMYKLAFERGWVRGTFERDGGSIQGVKMRSLQLALKNLSAKRHMEAMRIDHYRIDGRLIAGFGFRGMDAFDHFIKFGTKPPR